MATSNREGRGETTGPAGTRSDRITGGAATESTGGRPPTDTTTSAGTTSGGGYEPPQNPPQQPVQTIYLTTPVVYDLRSNKKRRRKKKYTRGLKTVQRTEDGLTQAGRRLADGLDEGFQNYRKRRNRSVRRKKDGPIRDIFPNTAGGLSRFLDISSDAPYEFSRRVNNRRFGKQVRDTVRFFTLPFFR